MDRKYRKLLSGRLLKRFTLVFVVKGGEILLGMKKRGFGKGKWNGFGGKVEKNESIPAAAQRGVQRRFEEICLLRCMVPNFFCWC